MDVVLWALGSLAVLAAAAGGRVCAVVKQVERGVVFRLGRAQPELRRQASRCSSRSWTG